MKKTTGILIFTILFFNVIMASEKDVDSTANVQKEYYSLMGESSANLYAGKAFIITDDNGSEFEYEVNEDGISVTLTKGNANGVDTLVIPSYVEALNSYFFVTEIGQFAYITYNYGRPSPMRGVKQLIISEGIEAAGQNAFDDAPDLETVVFPSSMRHISYGMFWNCKNLKSVQIPDDSKISEIESFAFAGCTSLETFTISGNVSDIGEGPWRDCVSLESLNIQEGNYNFVIEDGVLYKRHHNELLQYPAGKRNYCYQIEYGTEAIGNSAFYGNPFIEKVIVPASVDSISHIAFYGCTSLKEVVFSDSIDFIGNKAFDECRNLSEIILYGNPIYTNGADNVYNTFLKSTNVKIEKQTPMISFTGQEGSVLIEIFNYVSAYKDFHMDVIDNNEDYGFSKFLGEGRCVIYKNASPKKDVLNVLASIPSDLLVCEKVDDRGRITRFYLDKSDKKNPKVLYFFGGINGNDLVVVLFEKGNLKKINKYLSKIRK